MGVVLTIDGVFPDAGTEAAFVDAVTALVKTYAPDLSTATLSTDYNGSPELPVGEPVPALVISGTLTPATVGAPFHASLTASGGTAPYVWLADGLVDGLNIDSATGAITGTPNVAGAATIHVAVHDSSEPPEIASEDFSIIVAGPVDDDSQFVAEDTAQDARLTALEAGQAAILDKLNQLIPPPAA